VICIQHITLDGTSKPFLHLSFFFVTVEKQKCMQPECSLTDLEIPDPNCPLTPWSDWSPCSATCGKGVQIRTRLLLVEPEKEAECKQKKELNQQRQCAMRQDCVFDYETARQICTQESDAGSCRGAYKRFYYDPTRGACQEFEYGGCRGNQNNFLTHEICMGSCSLVRASVPNHVRSQITTSPRAQSQIDSRASSLPVDCLLSEWSDWSACSVACGKKTITGNSLISFAYINSLQALDFRRKHVESLEVSKKWFSLMQ
jgi:spondin-1